MRIMFRSMRTVYITETTSLDKLNTHKAKLEKGSTGRDSMKKRGSLVGKTC